MQKFTAIGDCHGRVPRIKQADIVLCTGDFCSSNARKYMFQAMKKRLKNPKDRTEWWEIIGKQKAKKIVRKSWQDGRKVVEKISSSAKKVFAVPGNWDWTEKERHFDHKTFSEMLQGMKNVKNVEMKLADAGNFCIIGYGRNSGPEIPLTKEAMIRWNEKGVLNSRMKEYEKTKSKLEKLFRRAKKPVIFLSHNVPYGTKLDRIKDKSSPRDGEHCGSIIVREIIEKFRPAVCIGGHIHRNFIKCRIGRTVCINAGYRTATHISI